MSESSITVIEKFCPGCAKTKPSVNFGRNRKNWHGLQDYCRQCRSARHAANAEKKAEYDKQYRADNRERLQQYQRDYYKQHREYILRRNRLWLEENREHFLKRCRAYYEENREHALRLWKINYEANKEKYIARARISRAKRRGAEGTHTLEDIEKKYNEQRCKCYWCKEKLNGKYHVDHIIPISKGGGNAPGNLCCACPACNLSKSDKMPWEFSDRLF